MRAVWFRSAVVCAALVCGGLSLAGSPPQGAAPGSALVRGLSAQADRDQLRVQISLTRLVTPRVMVLQNPDRLVLDFDGVDMPEAPQRIPVSAGPVTAVRMALWQTSPPITRVVIDGGGAAKYNIQNSGSTVIVSLPRAASAGTQVALQRTQPSLPPPQPPAPRITVHPAAVHPAPRPAPALPTLPPRATAPAQVATIHSPQPQPPVAPHPANAANTMMLVWFQNGNLRIMAKGSTLGEVLSAVAARTGIRIEFPPQAGQERVVADLGPGPLRGILERFLYGLPYNYLVVAAEGNPEQVREITLSAVSGMAQAAPIVTPATAPPPAPPPSAGERAQAAMLAVGTGGTGSGSFTLSPPGTVCGGGCTGSYVVGTTVVVIAQPNGGSVFNGWSQCDSVSGNSCTVALTENRSVVGTFTAVATPQ